ncbi:MAG: major facilitator superfamily 1, partial [Microbacteriaceae bacterium]|nr:major facilitator superfamily 1 [Microbacteriaceae bacterium]
MRGLPWAILLHALFLQLAAYIIRPTAAYRALELGIDAAYLGLIAASFAVVPLVVAMFVGRIADSGGENRLMALGAALMIAAGFGLLLYSPSLVMLLLWNVVLGLGHLMSVLGEQSRVAQLGGSRLDSAFGIYTFAGSIGQAIGPSLIGLFGGQNEIPDTSGLFATYIAATVVMSGITVWILARARGSAAAVRSTERVSIRA